MTTKRKKSRDLICQRIKQWESGENPYFVHEFKSSILVIGDHQFYDGYSLLLLKEHVRELHELETSSYIELQQELLVAGKAIFKAFSPWKMNYLCLGNTEQHVHWHIIPRYTTDPNHQTLPMTEYVKGEVDLSDYAISTDEARSLAARVRRCL